MPSVCATTELWPLLKGEELPDRAATTMGLASAPEPARFHLRSLHILTLGDISKQKGENGQINHCFTHSCFYSVFVFCHEEEEDGELCQLPWGRIPLKGRMSISSFLLAQETVGRAFSVCLQAQLPWSP